MKKSHERYTEIVSRHLATVDPREFNDRFHKASHGEFGDSAEEGDDTEPRPKRVGTRAARAVAAVGRLLGLFHLH